MQLNRGYLKVASDGSLYSNDVLLLLSRSVNSYSLWPHELQHTRLPCPSPSSRSFFKLLSIESVMPSNYLILCRPLLSVFPSIRAFSSELALCPSWPKYWSFSISPFNVYSGLISFKIGWFYLLAVQGTLKSLLQHHSSKALVFSFLYGSTLIFIHDYWKNHSLDYMDICWQSDVSAF